MPSTLAKEVKPSEVVENPQREKALAKAAVAAEREAAKLNLRKDLGIKIIERKMDEAEDDLLDDLS